MNLNVYTMNLEYLGVIDTYESLRWRTQIFGAGEVELQCQANKNNLSIATKATKDGDIVIMREDLPEEFAIIDGFAIEENAETGSVITLTGRLGPACLDRCTIDRTYNISGRTEASMHRIITEQMPRVVSNITNGMQSGFTQTLTAQIGYKNLLSTITALSRASGILFKIRADVARHVFVFETFEGINRTVSQNTNPRVVFSDLDEKLSYPKFEQNKKNYRNYAFIGGEGEGENRIFTTIDRTNGSPRRECFIDAKDLRRESLTLPAYISLLQARGQEKLDELIVAQSFESTVSTDCAYKLRVDYNIGDVVTTHKSAWGIMIDDRVTEIEEVYDVENGDVGSITPTFGSPLPEKFSV